MALAEVATAAEVEVGERRWAEWWALPSHDVELGAALLTVFDGWDGDTTRVSCSVRERFRALERRLTTYEDWCAQLRVAPARRPVGLSAQVVDGQGDELGRGLCGDCEGSAIVTDDDGSLSGLVGMLVDCGCTDGPWLGPGVVEACGVMLGRPMNAGERQVALMVDYLATCRARRIEPAWCLACGAYVAESPTDCTCDR
jgi:hypothetical protein